MSTYVIGDVQGCYLTLRGLVDRLPLDPSTDRLWFVGDLVNRGPRSLEVLRWVRDLGDRAVVVLGNHDLRLLALGQGVRHAGRRDTLQEVLDAPDRDELLLWLRHRPLLHHEEGVVLVHAGLLPCWTPEQAREIAAEASRALQGGLGLDRLQLQPVLPWKHDMEPGERLRVAINALTSLRTVDPTGLPEVRFKGSPPEAPGGCVPWFRFPSRRSAGTLVVFGHWSALGLLDEPEVLAVDTGCVWGRGLAAVRLEDRESWLEPTADGESA